MEHVMDAIKAYIKNHPEAFTAEATQDCPVVAPREKDILLGTVDLSRYENNIIVSIIGDTDDDEPISISDVDTDHSLTVTFLCRGYQSEILARQICRYAEAFRKLILADSTLDGEVDDSSTGQRRYYPDCGTVEDQMAAVEIDLSVSTILTI